MMGQIKRDISIIISICALTLSMIMGLAIDARPEIILIRAFLSLFVSAIFIFLLGSIIEKFSKNPQNSLLDNKNIKENEADDKHDNVSNN